MSYDVGEVGAELILQPFLHFTYIITHSPTLPSLYLRHSSFSNPSFASPTSQPPHSPTLTSLDLCHSSFSNPSAALPTSQLYLQPFLCFTYVIGTSPTSQLILQPFRRFIYATARFTTLPPLQLRHKSFYNPSVA